MKYLIAPLFAFLFTACGSYNYHASIWERTKEASYNAITDPTTWGTALAATVLYTTNYDHDITNHLMDHPISWLEDNKEEKFRSINRIEMFATSLFIEDDTYFDKFERTAMEFIAAEIAKESASLLKNNIQRTNPKNSANDSIGSNHAVDHFAMSGITKRNVDRLSIPTWSKYALNTISYASASLSALSRVQEGGHSFADQLVNASIGNFLGIFLNDLMVKDPRKSIISTGISKDGAIVRVGWRY